MTENMLRVSSYPHSVRGNRQKDQESCGRNEKLTEILLVDIKVTVELLRAQISPV